MATSDIKQSCDAKWIVELETKVSTQTRRIRALEASLLDACDRLDVALERLGPCARAKSDKRALVGLRAALADGAGPRGDATHSDKGGE